MYNLPIVETIAWEEISGFCQEVELATLFFADTKTLQSYVLNLQLQFNTNDEPVFVGSIPSQFLPADIDCQQGRVLVVFQHESQQSFFAAHISGRLKACYSHWETKICRVEISPDSSQIFHHINPQIEADLAEQELADAAKMLQLLNQN